MLLWRDPMVEGPPPRKLTPEEIAANRKAALRAKEAADAAARQRAARRMVELAAFIPRELVTGKDSRRVARPKVAETKKLAMQSLKAKKQLSLGQGDSRKQLAARFGVAERELLQNGATSKITGTFGGRPVAVQSDNYFAADLSGIASLWPSGLNNITAPAANPALPPLWSTGGSGLDPIRKAIQTERFLDFRLWGQVMGQAGGLRRGIEGLLNDRIV